MDDKIFLDSPFGSEKVVIGIAEIESSVLAAKVYFILHCSGSEDIALLSTTLLLSCHLEKRRNQPQYFYLWASV